MAQFQFTLESVLRLRRRNREMCLERLGVSLRELERLKAQHREALDEREELRDYLRKLSEPGRVDMGLVSRCQMHLAQLERRNAEAIFATEEAERIVAERRREYQSADQKVKALERMEEKQLAEHARQRQLGELREQEEILAGLLLRDREL